MTSFRPLLIFWAVTLALLAAAAATLQFLGPPPGLPATPPQTQAARPIRPATPPPPPVAAAIPPPNPNAIAEPDPALQEAAIDLTDRVLPRISDSGTTAAQLYAAHFDQAERHPRIAVVIDGIGLDNAISQQVLNTLPIAIDIAFSAYATATDAARLALAARRQGRECLVSIPMEPSGFPAVEEGVKSLLTGGDPERNRENLDWSLSNVQGCVGATGASDGMAGERFAASRQAYGDVMSAIAHRGLLYLDPRPGAPPPEDEAAAQGLSRVADLVIDRARAPDSPATAETIDTSLATLEKLAAEHGSAIGLAGPPRPVLLERLAVWANGLAARGLVLAPLTAIPPPRALAQEAPP